MPDGEMFYILRKYLHNIPVEILRKIMGFYCALTIERTIASSDTVWLKNYFYNVHIVKKQQYKNTQLNQQCILTEYINPLI